MLTSNVFDILSCMNLQTIMSIPTSCIRVTIIVIFPEQSFRFFQDWWAEVTHGAKNGGSFSEMIGPSISN